MKNKCLLVFLKSELYIQALSPGCFTRFENCENQSSPESDLRNQFLEQSTLAIISKVNLYMYEWSKIFKPDKCIFSFVLGNTGSMVVLDPFVILAYNGISSWHRNTTQIGIPLLKKSTQCLNTYFGVLCPSLF